jgi:xanthine dehydrogenase iron-sulfur cluster and FAD-binding subunit A
MRCEGDDMTCREVAFKLNGQEVLWTGDPSIKLLDVLRADFEDIGVKCGCREGECGACAVLLDGVMVNSCMVAIGRVGGSELLTIEGYRSTERFKVLDAAFARHTAVQCGYCIPGMVLAAEALLSKNPEPTASEVREAISGNLCRCTGYNAIVAAILEAAKEGAGLWKPEMGQGEVGPVGQGDVSGVPEVGQGDVSGVPVATPTLATPTLATPTLATLDDASPTAHSAAVSSPTPALATPTPITLDDALEMLANQSLIPYAGGTDLMVAEERQRDFLFLHTIAELKVFEEDEQAYHLGAGLTFTELLAEPRTPALLREAVASIAAPAIRNAGTIGGNVANASPKGDSALVLFVTDSQVRLASRAGVRTLPLSEFYLGRGRTARRPDEVVTEFIMPRQWLGDYGFTKVGGRAALAISRVSFAGLLNTDGGVVRHFALAFGAVEDVVVRRPELDALLIGLTTEEARAKKEVYLSRLAEALQPIRGRVSADYRKQVCLNLAREFLDSRLG